MVLLGIMFTILGLGGYGIVSILRYENKKDMNIFKSRKEVHYILERERKYRIYFYMFLIFFILGLLTLGNYLE